MTSQAHIEVVKQTQMNIGPDNKFMDLEGVDKVEVLWLNRVMGTPFIHHPVSRKRARDILNEIKKAAVSNTFFIQQAG